MKTIKYKLNEMAEKPFIFKLVLAIINPLFISFSRFQRRVNEKKGKNPIFSS
jgi:hypothetical protein